MLHALFLGIVKMINNDLLLEMLLADCCNIGCKQSVDERVTTRLSLILPEVFSFYEHWRRQRPDYLLTPMQDLTVPMIGSQHKRKLAWKVSETKGFQVLAQ